MADDTTKKIVEDRQYFAVGKTNDIFLLKTHVFESNSFQLKHNDEALRITCLAFQEKWSKDFSKPQYIANSSSLGGIYFSRGFSALNAAILCINEIIEVKMFIAQDDFCV